MISTEKPNNFKFRFAENMVSFLAMFLASVFFLAFNFFIYLVGGTEGAKV